MMSFVSDLQTLELDSNDEDLRDWLTNWTYLSMKLQETGPLTARDYMVLIKFELDGLRRKDIINRLTSRFCAVRRKEEWQELVKAYKL